FLRPHAAGEQSQHFELTSRQLRLHRPWRRRTAGLLEPIDANDELVEHERLGDVVVGTEEQPRHTIERFGAHPGYEDDADAVTELLAELSTDLVAGKI